MTEEHQTAAKTHGAMVTTYVEALTAELDAAKADGLAIPPRAAEAMRVLLSLGMAWTYNGAGMSCPPEVRKPLGV
jgi:hypothetical protein